MDERTKVPAYKRPCSVEDCVTLVGKGARGLCALHYERLINHGTTDPVVPGYKRACSVENCAALIGKGSQGLCQLHHRRLIKHGTTNPVAPLPAFKRPCSIEDCATLVGKGARGLCRTHYRRLVKYGTTDPVVPAYKQACSVEGCEVLVGVNGARGLCHLHYDHLRRNGHTGLAERMYKRTCTAAGCDEPARKMELCGNHYAHKQRHGDENAPYSHRWADERICIVCGAKDWPQNGYRKVCSANCRGRLAYHDGTPPPEQRTCDHCGMLVDLTVRSAKSGHIKRSDTKMCRICKQARSTRHKTSATFLAKRDGTDCKICGDPVDMTLRKPSVWGPSVDHIYPWAKGGTHDLDNLQLAHLWCNQAKSAQLDFSLAV